MKISSRSVRLGLLFVGASGVAQAHPGHDGHELTWDFSTGFAHPFTGWDHIVAMLAIGWWAVQLSGRARWYIPATFLALLALSAAVGQAALRQSLVEQGIAASIIVLGLLVAAAVRLPSTASAALVGAFGVFHGLAHGAEMTANANVLSFGLGFESASACLLAGGMVFGLLGSRVGRLPERIAGTTAMLLGVLMLSL